MITASERTRGPGDLLAGRYRLDDLLSEAYGGRNWLAHDLVLSRAVAVHVIDATNPRAAALLAAARASAGLLDRRILKVLDAETLDGVCYVVTEWAEGSTLDVLLADGPLEADRASWLIAEVGSALSSAHADGHAHGRLLPETILVDRGGTVRIIGFGVDAALVGLPPGSVDGDVHDLAALLYAALTGRWAGRAPSGRLPSAPYESGRLLRARQVRAGVPAHLDTLCDVVLSPSAARGTHAKAAPDAATAASIVAAIQDLVGDRVAIAQALAASATTRLAAPSVSLPPEVPRSRQPAPPAQLLGTPDPGDTAERPPVDPDQTQAGVPVFDDDREVVLPPPPPPFAPAEPKPLFAPETPGTESSRGRAPAPTVHEATAGTSLGEAVAAETANGPAVPGRGWLRVAGIIGALVLLLLAVVAAYNLGQGRTVLGGDASPATDAPAAPTDPTGAPLTISAISDFDPMATPAEERPQLVPLAFDGDPGTAWRTEIYEQNFGPGGLKTGLGLILDLGQTRDVTRLDLEFNGEPTAVSIDVSDVPPVDADDVTPIADFEGGETLRATFNTPVSGRYVTLWLTSLPSVEDGFRAEIAEVVVRG